MKKTIIFISFICVLSNVLAQDVYHLLKVDLQSELDRIVKNDKLPGMNFSIQFDALNQINLAAGFQDKEEGIPMTTESRMPGGSVGKMFFSAIALKLVQDGQLNLKNKVINYLGDTDWFPSFPNASEIEIINLMNHTSGLPRHLFQEGFLKDFIQNPQRKIKPEDCIKVLRNAQAVCSVGKGWSYSDANFILLGLIIEKITKRDLYEIVEKDLIQRLHLSSTSPSDDRVIAGLAQGYVGKQNPFQLPSKIIDEQGTMVLDPSFEWAGRGYVTTPGDLVRFAKFLHEGNYLNKETQRHLKSAVSLSTGRPFDHGYGLGTFVWAKKNDLRYGHSGFFPGYSSHVEYSTNRQYAIAIQINTDDAFPFLQQYVYQLEKVIEKHLGRIDSAKIKHNFKEQEICWNQADIECYMEAYSSLDSIQTASRAGITYGYDAIISNYKKYFPKDKMGQLFFDNISITKLSDQLCFVTGRFNLKFPDREELVKGWFSTNMKRINGAWYMITDHSS